MCSAAHLVVVSLKRVAVGRLRLDPALAPGEWRDLTEEELSLLAQT
jgi:16S rRNA pseudouridine516 synthase